MSLDKTWEETVRIQRAEIAALEERITKLSRVIRDLIEARGKVDDARMGEEMARDEASEALKEHGDQRQQ